MNKTLILSIFTIAILITISTPAFSQYDPKKHPKADARVAAMFKERDYKYDITPNGNYTVIFDTSKTRGQLVYIMSKTSTFGKLDVSKIETRRIQSTAWRGKKPPSDKLMLKLMMRSANSIAGGWIIMKNADGYHLTFLVNLPTSASTSEFTAAIRAALYAADYMEAELSDEDFF